MRTEIGIKIPFPADEVWRLAGGFDLLPTISTATAISRLEQGGRLRVLVNRDGSVMWEKMLHFDDAARSLSYEITDTKAFGGAYGPGYKGFVQVSPQGDTAALFHYSADFEPAAGFSPDLAKAAVEAFATDCAAGIARALAAGQTG